MRGAVNQNYYFSSKLTQKYHVSRRERSPRPKSLGHLEKEILTCTATHLPWRAVPGNAARRKCRYAPDDIIEMGSRNFFQKVYRVPHACQTCVNNLEL